ncbi:MAG: eCIS core domain-containing protein [Segetibacter sp.]
MKNYTLTEVKIKENSWLARMAAKKLKSGSMAMVVGKTIHLHNSSREDFLRNKRWVRHEVAHVKQYAQLGAFRFIFLYLLETFNKGYENNQFEVDAREKERDKSILSEIHFN